jgi:hypothetical protein
MVKELHLAFPAATVLSPPSCKGQTGAVLIKDSALEDAAGNSGSIFFSRASLGFRLRPPMSGC